MLRKNWVIDLTEPSLDNRHDRAKLHLSQQLLARSFARTAPFAAKV
jgi:hypothetical protein